MDATPTIPAAPDDANEARPEASSTQPGAAPRDTGAAGDAGDAKKKKPVDEKKRARDRLAARLRRQAKAVKSAKTVEELHALEASLGTGGDAPAEASAGAGGALAKKTPAAEVLEPGQLPGWPKPSDVEKQRPMALMIWNRAAEQLAPTRYGRCLAPQPAAVEVRDGEQVITAWVDPRAQLADASAPVLAQWLGAVSAMSPTSALLVAVAGTFGPTAAAHVGEFIAGLLKPRPKAAGGVALQ